MSDNWIKELDERMETFVASEPEGLWEDIEAALPVRRSRIAPVWIWSLPLAAALAAALVLLRPTVPEGQSARPRTVVSGLPQEGSVPGAGTVLDAEEQMADPALAATEEKQLRRISEVPQSPSAVAQSVPEQDVREPEAPVQLIPRSTDAKEESARLAQAERAETEPLWELLEAERPKRKSQMSLSLYGALTGRYQHEQQTFGAVPQRLLSRSATAPTNEYMELALRNRPTTTSETHHRSPRIGLQFAWNLTDRWAVESGFFYTRPTSLFRSGTEEHYAETRQKLDFVGLPLQLRYHLLPQRGARQPFSLYLAGGGAVQRCLGFSAWTDRYVLDKRYAHEPVSEPTSLGWQFSLEAAAGLSYTFLPPGPVGRMGFSLFVEPGLAWYLPSQSDLRCIYSDKALNLTLSIGIRMAL